MKKSLIGALAVTSTLLSPMAAMAQTEVHFWHAFTGRLGELVKGQVADFNASQNDYVVVESHKGNYSETLNAGIAAFRAKKSSPHPHGVRSRHRDHDGRRRRHQAGLRGDGRKRRVL